MAEVNLSSQALGVFRIQVKQYCFAAHVASRQQSDNVLVYAIPQKAGTMLTVSTGYHFVHPTSF